MENKAQTYYHYTLKENIFNIMKEGLMPGDDGLIYLCTSVEDCTKFVNACRETLSLATGSPIFEVAFIPVELDPADVEESHDHNENLIPCKAYTYDKAIPPEKFPSLIKSRCISLRLKRRRHVRTRPEGSLLNRDIHSRSHVRRLTQRIIRAAI